MCIENTIQTATKENKPAICPTCRHPFPPGTTSAIMLRPNFALCRVVADSASNIAAPLVVSCTKARCSNKNVPAVSWCAGCPGVAMCEKCSEIHADFYSGEEGHELKRDLREFWVESNKRKLEIIEKEGGVDLQVCKDHPPNILQLHCRGCGKLACLMCERIVYKGEGHEYVPLQEEAKQTRARLARLREKLMQHSKQVLEQIEIDRTIHKNAAVAGNIIREEVTQMFGELIARVTKHRDTVLNGFMERSTAHRYFIFYFSILTKAVKKASYAIDFAEITSNEMERNAKFISEQVSRAPDRELTTMETRLTNSIKVTIC